MQPPPFVEPTFAPGPTPPDAFQANGLKVDAWSIGNGWATWAPVDKSQVAQDLQKWKAMPAGLEEIEGYQERLGDDGWEVTRYWQCPWSQTVACQQWFLGYAYVDTVTQLAVAGQPPPPPTYAIRRVIPAQDAYRPYLYCETAEVVQGKGAWILDPSNWLRDPATGGVVDQNGNDLVVVPQNPGPNDPHPVLMPAKVYADQVGQETFEDGWAVLRAKYRPRPYPVRNDTDAHAHALGERSRFVSVKRSYAIQSLPYYRVSVMGAAKLLFAEGPFAGSQIPEPGVLLLPTQRITLTLWDWPFDPNVAIQATMGKLNATAFQPAPGWPTYAGGTLLMEAPDVRKISRNACGQVSYTLDLNLAMRPQGWNRFPAPNGNFYAAAYADGSTVYQSAGFDQLFAPGPAMAW